MGAVLFNEEWKAAKQISDIPFIDEAFYDDEIHGFKAELSSLGVIVCFSTESNYQLVIKTLKPSSGLTALEADAFLLSLKCIRYAKSPDHSDSLVRALTNAECLKTNLGCKSPSECFLFDDEWGCLLQVYSCFPVIEHAYYGSIIFSYKNELKTLGVVVDFEVAVESFACSFKQQASLSCVTKQTVLSFLPFYRQLEKTSHKFSSELKIASMK